MTSSALYVAGTQGHLILSCRCQATQPFPGNLGFSSFRKLLLLCKWGSWLWQGACCFAIRGKGADPNTHRAFRYYLPAEWHGDVFQHPSSLLVSLKITKILSLAVSLAATAFDPSFFLWTPPLGIPPE